MNKEDILKMSQQENSGKPDERELAAIGKASRTGMAAGAILCAILIVVGNFIDKPEFAAVGWMVYLTMNGFSNIALFKQLRNRKKLIYGIIDLALAAAFAVAIIVKGVA